MEKAFMYDSLCGIVFRCMFAGVDELGNAHWVNITPGEQPKTLEDYLIREEMEDCHFTLICMEGEEAQSAMVARVLGKVAECPFNSLDTDLTLTLKQMQDLGMKWNKKPLGLTFRVLENAADGKRMGKYSFWVEDNTHGGNLIADIDGYCTLEDLFGTIRTYIMVLENTAGIPVLDKDLRISSKLKKEAKKSDLELFNNVICKD